MFEWRKSVVYCSKNKEDWEKAQTLLKEAGIDHEPWHSQEPGMAGCGAKIDIRTLAAKGPVPKDIYKIEVASARLADAQRVLDGRVQPVHHYGVG